MSSTVGYRYVGGAKILKGKGLVDNEEVQHIKLSLHCPTSRPFIYIFIPGSIRRKANCHSSSELKNATSQVGLPLGMDYHVMFKTFPSLLSAFPRALLCMVSIRFRFSNLLGNFTTLCTTEETQIVFLKRSIVRIYRISTQ